MRSRNLAVDHPETNNGLSVRVVACVKCWALAGVVLLFASGACAAVACPKHANLLLARAAQRQKEVAIRGPGCGEASNLRQFMAESA